MYYSNHGTPTGLKTHLHQLYEFLYFIDGDSSFIVENTIYDISPGSLLITRPGEVHSLSFHTQHNYIRKFFQIAPDYLIDIKPDLLETINNSPFGTNNIVSPDKCRSIKLMDFYNNIEYYVQNQMPESNIMIKTYVIQLLVKLNPLIKTVNTETFPASFENSRISDVLEYIEEHLTDKLSLDRLSEKFFINKYYLCHSFKSETGVTIKEFINTRRISKAKDLLSQGYNITDLCYQCGFGDYSSFYKTFKKMTGKSPKEFLSVD